jgi:hypothetical protein
MLSPEWHTFPTKDLHSDAAVFQFQLLYEHMEMFRRQKWLGEWRPLPVWMQLCCRLRCSVAA